jgi:hypothetical protein
MSLARPDENSLKTIVYTPMADYRTAKDFNFTVNKSLTVPVLFNEKYHEMNDTAKPILSNFLK